MIFSKHTGAQATAIQTVEKRQNSTPHGIPPARGEPAQPRGALAPQRRRRVYPNRAVCKTRNHNRGLRSQSRLEARRLSRLNRNKQNRTLFRRFKQFSLNYTLKQKALDMRRRLHLWRRMGKSERRRQFHHFVGREKNGSTEHTIDLAYGKEIKIVSLNVRGLKGEQAAIKRKLLINIMEKIATTSSSFKKPMSIEIVLRTLTGTNSFSALISKNRMLLIPNEGWRMPLPKAKAFPVYVEQM